MVTQSLIDYIKVQLGQNVQTEAIKSALQAAGWQNEDIESGFSSVEASITLSNLEVEPHRTEPRTVQQSRTGAWVKQAVNDKKPMTDDRNLESETAQRTTGLSMDETPVVINQIEPKAEVQKPTVQAEQAGPTTEAKMTTQTPETLSAGKFPRDKRLEEKDKQKKILRSAFNILFGVFLGVGLTLGLQFVLGRLFVNKPELSPSPIARPSPLGLSLADIPYKNEELGVEIFYPSGWGRNLDLEGASSGVKSVSFESGGLANILIEVLPIDPLEKNVSLEKVLEKSLAEMKANHPDFVSLGQTKSSASDLPAYIVDGGYSFQEGLNLKMKVLQAVFINESREFYVNMVLAAKEENWQDYRPVFERIIDEFKLTK